jgi:hypothetical protein
VSGHTLPIRVICVDAGYATQDVYAWMRQHPQASWGPAGAAARQPRTAVAVKGRDRDTAQPPPLVTTAGCAIYYRGLSISISVGLAQNSSVIALTFWVDTPLEHISASAATSTFSERW